MKKTGEQHFKKMRQIAEANGGKLLSTEWAGGAARYCFAFADGREFERSAAKLISRGWPKDRLSELRCFVESNGGQLLSSEWKGNKASYRFSFCDGREFETTAASIMQGWPKSADRYLKKSTYNPEREQSLLDELRRLAEVNSGRLLSTQWNGSAAPYRFAFSDGREFSTRAASIKRHGWPKDADAYFRCSGNPDRGEIHLSELREIAEINGGRLLSTEWKGSQTKHRFAFADGREFAMRPNVLKRGWPQDPDDYFRKHDSSRGGMHLSELRLLAEEKGGKLLSSEWKGIEDPYLFEDQAGMQFYCRASSIKTGSWSPYSGLVSECVVRRVFKFLFGLDFQRTRAILKRPEAYPLELDGYENSVQIAGTAIRMAFEYQGHTDHYENSQTIYRDIEKVRLCAEKKIVLVTVDRFRNKDPWDPNYVLSHVREAINRALAQANLGTIESSKNEIFDLNLSRIHVMNERIRELSLIAQVNGGKLLSLRWKGSEARYRFAFQDGREFRMSAAVMMSRGWPQDADMYFRKGPRKDGMSKVFLEELRCIAEQHSGKLLTSEWLGSQAKYRFAFADGREFEMRPCVLRKGWPKDQDRYFKRIAVLAAKKIQGDEIVSRITKASKVPDTASREALSRTIALICV